LFIVSLIKILFKMKRFFLHIMIFAALAAPVGLASCGSDSEELDTDPEVNNELSGSITGVRTLDPSIEYKLTGTLIVEEGGVLNIPAGTVIKSQKGFSNYILVLQGGKIFAKGTAEKPVVITADVPDAGAGYWGGLVINGRAKISGVSGQTATGTTEINPAYLYGGDNDSDSSGELTYVKLAYCGARSSADIEHNGLTLNGVGSGTKIENIYILESADDGIEFFGGAVDVKNLLVVNSDDDMFDMTQGYSGTIDNCYGIWETGYTSTESDPRGVEADGNLDGKTPDDVNQSDFAITNMTIDLKLAPSENTNAIMQDVIKIRRGAAADIANALVKGTGTVLDLVDCTDGAGDADAATTISLTNRLSTPIKEKETKPGVNNATIIIEDNNTGCPTSIFSWTGYTCF
jgi:hypothetical protein